MAKSLRDEVELMAGAYALASVTKVSPVKVADYLREILDRHPIDPEWETGYAQALEFAQYVEDHAKGAMIEAAKRFLSLPYSQALAKRIAPADGVVVPGDTQLIDWIEARAGCNLVSDDNGAWAMSTSGIQPVPDEDGFAYPVAITSFVEPAEWKPSVRAAIMAAIADEQDAILAQRSET